MEKDKINDLIDFEEIESEEEDKQIDNAPYKINTYGADFVVQTLIQKIKDKEIVIPPFQRKYVWDNKKASKLIESFLLGLPVPQIFLYRSQKSQALLVVDGQQRLKTLLYFINGRFWDDNPFILKNVHQRWEGKLFDELEEADKRRLKNSILRATIFEQIDPKDNESIFEIFERLNTGGVTLTPQEIRNCVIRGKINKFLEELNKDLSWRALLGNSNPDKRMRDIEMMLRFFALYEKWEKYRKTMKDFINDYMEENKDISYDKQEELSNIFKETMKKIKENIGERAFKLKGGINISIFDSISVAIARNKKNLQEDLLGAYKKLIANPLYLDTISKSTTDTDRVNSRIKFAISTFSK